MGTESLVLGLVPLSQGFGDSIEQLAGLGQ